MALKNYTLSALLSAFGAPEIVNDLVDNIENIQPGQIADGAVTTPKLADLAVTNAKIAAGIDAAKIGSAVVDNTEFSYLDGVTSAIQTQLNAKLASSSFTDSAVTSKLLTGYVSGAGVVAGSDTILQGFNKLNGNDAAISAVANAALPSASFTSAAVTAKLLTGFVSGAGTVTSADSILTAFNKLNGNIALKVTAVSSTDNAAVRFDSTAGQVQNSGVIIDDSNNITGVGSLTLSSFIKASDFRSLAASPADGGAIRLGNSQSVSWRNFGNTDNISISVNPSDQILLGAPLLLVNGTVGAPAEAFASDTDTGVYWVGANSFGIAAGGFLIASFLYDPLLPAGPKQLKMNSTAGPADLVWNDQGGGDIGSSIANGSKSPNNVYTINGAEMIGGATSPARPVRFGGQIYYNDVAETIVGGAGDEDLMPYSLNTASGEPTIQHSGQYIEFEYTGTYAANANAKTVKIFVDATEIMNSGALAINNGSWIAKGRLYRVDNTTLKINCTFTTSSTLLQSKVTFTSLAPGGGIDTRFPFVLKATGASAGADITSQLLLLNFQNNSYNGID